MDPDYRDILIDAMDLLNDIYDFLSDSDDPDQRTIRDSIFRFLETHENIGL